MRKLFRFRKFLRAPFVTCAAAVIYG
jgi:hypothetical protein